MMVNTLAERKAQLPSGFVFEFVPMLHSCPWQQSYEHVSAKLLPSLQRECGLEHSLPEAQSLANILVMLFTRLAFCSESFVSSPLKVIQCSNRNGHVFSTLCVLQWSQEMVLRQEKHSVPEI